MTRREAKNYLGQIQRGLANLDRMRDEVTRLRSAAAGTGSGLNTSGIRTSLDTDRMARNIEEALAAERVLQEETYQFWKMRVRILEELHALSDAQHIELLYLRYFEGMSHAEIVCEMQKSNRCRYSDNYVRHLHGKALDDFAHTHSEIDSSCTEIFGKEMYDNH